MNRRYSTFSCLLFIVVGLAFTIFAQASAQAGCKCPILNGSQMAFVGCKPNEALSTTIARAKQGNPKALYILGRLYELGGKTFGLPQIKWSNALAERYYLESARRGYVQAQAAIGWMYGKYRAGQKRGQSQFWFCKAAEQYNDAAIVNIRDEINYERSKKTWQEYCKPILKKGEPK